VRHWEFCKLVIQSRHVQLRFLNPLGHVLSNGRTTVDYKLDRLCKEGDMSYYSTLYQDRPGGTDESHENR
jgi:hypothetical protein